MKGLLSVFTRNFSVAPNFGVASAHFFAKRFASTLAYHPRTSPFAHPIPKLPIIDSMVEMAGKLQLPSLDRTAVISVQHILETTATLFRDGILKLGVSPKNVFLAGKFYSTSPGVFTAISDLGIDVMATVYPKNIGQYQAACYESATTLWKRFMQAATTKAFDRVVILDDGGWLFKTVPPGLSIDPFRSVVGIEQTRGGLYTPITDALFFPLIEVASSAAKRILESPLIADAILSRVKPIMSKLRADRENTVFGVIGNGAIGSAIINYLLSEGFKVTCYDENDQSFRNNRFHRNAKNLYRTSKITSVIANSHIIFGCTGRDVTYGIDVFEFAHTNKTFISCTCGDEEFHSLLNRIATISGIRFDPLEDVYYTTNHGATIFILSGGTPFNFNRMPYSVPSHDIEITRSLLFGAFLQALRCTEKPIGDGFTINDGKRLCLNPYIQRYAAMLWGTKQSQSRYPMELISQLQNIGTITEKSGGAYQPDLLLEEVFSGVLSVHKVSDSSKLPQSKM